MELPWQKKQDIGRAVSLCLSGPLPTHRSPRTGTVKPVSGTEFGNHSQRVSFSSHPYTEDYFSLSSRLMEFESWAEIIIKICPGSSTSVPINRKELIYNLPLLAGQHDGIYS